ncbi:MAG: MOSC domain-containing protein [Deltaproteobacteria bacterium]
MISLTERLKIVPQVGTVEWIGVRPSRGAAMQPVDEVEAVADRGLVGDRYRANGTRQVTLVQAEHVPVIAALAGHEVTPALLRRNLVIAGINLMSLQKQRFAIGEVVLLGTSSCAPCDKMEASIGEGTFQAMRGHGGLCAKIERGGLIRRGDRVRLL